MRKIKWGILGPGRIAHQFAADFKYVKNAELVAVASRSKERAKDFAQAYNIPKVYNSYADLCKDPEVDAVYVATPHNFHYQMTLDALNAGKAVLCEKPITISPAEFNDLSTISKQKGIYLMEGMWTYFLPAIKKAKEWATAGKIGNIVSIKSEFGFYRDFDPESRLFNPDLAGGAIFDLGIYNIAITHLFAEQEPLDSQVILQKAESGVENDANILSNYGSSSANLHCSLKSDLSKQAIVYGDKGRIEIPEFWRANECKLFVNDALTDNFNDGRTSNGFNYEIEAVSNDLLNDKKESEVITHELSAMFQRQMEEFIGK